ncbi:MAG: hypothetical protein A2289_21845 [Deltaproteobacteria bacterium RIFOXYA12_FULL_58_15]|nr:MAG: hypothetical protein A2289_21845 [Deltaproteobacteria bacterium RIFOXYA12_FULL_58_15]OGR08932.1 MAG: hypothetical protein A2341_12705 [Deltaproteobacteria bacterium RIFOXYB12_FULL_58_9]
MLLGALCDLGAESVVQHAIKSLEIDGLELIVQPVEVDGETALHVRSIPRSVEPHHRHLADVFEILATADVPPAALALARRIFVRLGEAEAAVHGTDGPHEVHLHEVGQLDSILDVLGIAVALHSLGTPRVSCAPLPSGSGTVSTAHGVLNCPVPAVREIAARANVPLVDVPLVGETITPTGIAVIAEICTSYRDDLCGDARLRGVGAGSRRFDSRPNVLRAYGFEGDTNP